MIAGTNQRQGCLTDIVVGVLGAAIGGWLLNTLTGVDNVIDFSLSSLLVAVLGAVILLVVLKVLRR
jgi:uncharacterized membrane protein YeaQ/YmgE (transglycosylase-associated protein family)